MSKDKITKAMISEWIKQPVTREYMNIVREILESNKDQMTGMVINGPSLGQQDLHILSQLKGQILALEQVLQTKEFLSELTEEEVKQNEK